jgi:hypothetical protein
MLARSTISYLKSFPPSFQWKKKKCIQNVLIGNQFQLKHQQEIDSSNKKTKGRVCEREMLQPPQQSQTASLVYINGTKTLTLYIDLLNTPSTVLTMTTYLMLLLLLALSVASLIKPSFAMFLSINCGGSNSFVDANSIEWTGDADYVHNGVSQVVDAYYTAGPVMGTLRVFPTLKKNCYTINNLNNGDRVLVRASFFYGNYDGKHISPTFDLMLDGNMWGKVNLSIYSEDTILYREYVYDVNGNSTSLCLAQTLPDQFPLISALELRTLDSNMYRHAGSNHVLSLAARFAMGSLVDFRYSIFSILVLVWFSIFFFFFKKKKLAILKE